MSVGWASLRGKECSIPALLQTADERMYAAKDAHHKRRPAAPTARSTTFPGVQALPRKASSG